MYFFYIPTAPLPTYVMGPTSKDHVSFYDPLGHDGGELCDNITFLGEFVSVCLCLHHCVTVFVPMCACVCVTVLFPSLPPLISKTALKRHSPQMYNPLYLPKSIECRGAFFTDPTVPMDRMDNPICPLHIKCPSYFMDNPIDSYVPIPNGTKG